MDFTIHRKSPIVQKELFKKAINEHYPNLIIESSSFIPEGEDFYVFQVNDDLIFRFAKSEREVEKLKFENDLLPKLISTLTISIPSFTYKNFTDKNFSFVGYKKIMGIPFNVLGDRESVEYSAKTIGSVIAKLNEFRSQDKEELERQRKSWVKYFTGFIEKIKEVALQNLAPKSRNVVLDILLKNEATFLSYKFTPCPIHSDFKSSHILCDNHNKMIGLIDWGDSNYADVAFDFARILNEFGFDFLHKVKESVSSKVDFEIDRIAFYTIMIPFFTILQGLVSNDETKLQTGKEKLEFNLENYSNLL